MLQNINGGLFEAINNGKEFEAKFYKTGHFKIYMGSKYIEKIENWLKDNKCSLELIRKIGICRKVINRLYDLLDSEDNNNSNGENGNIVSEITDMGKQMQKVEISAKGLPVEAALNIENFIQTAI